MAKAAKAASEYHNNPFFIALEGLKVFFNKASSVGILFIVLSFVGVLGNGAQTASDIADSTKSDEQIASEQAEFESFFTGMSMSDWIMVSLIGGTILFLLILVGVVIAGIADYTSAKLAKNEATTLGEAFKEVFHQVGSYLWLSILIFIKIFLWSLLFIIPGIIMAVRYALAGTAFFAEGLRGNAAIKRSLALTKGAWLTTFASHSLWNIITFGLITAILQPGTNGLLYRQYSALTDAGKPKPDAHILSWLTLVLPIILVVFFVLVVAALVFAVLNFVDAA